MSPFARAMLAPLTEQHAGPGLRHLQRILPRKVAGDLATLMPVADVAMQGLWPEYPDTTRVCHSRLISVLAAGTVRSAPAPAEWLPPEVCQGLPSWRDAALAIHAPQTRGAWMPASAARTRLALDELTARQVRSRVVRDRRQTRACEALQVQIDFGLAPFTLTPSQAQALQEIATGMQSTAPMQRLLQGDVGSGKSIVAQLAAAAVGRAGWQAAIMAPTEILAKQLHAKTVPIMQAAGLRCVFIGGGQSKAKREALAALADGRAHVAVGTHALLTGSVQWHRLGLAIIDEQQRFGVDQRAVISAGRHTLMMSATPIPRTLAAALHGDLDISTLERPPGRLPVVTTACETADMRQVIAQVREQAAAGRAAFWVLPMIDENPELDLATVTERHAHLQQALPEFAIGVAHGAMPARARDQAMSDLRDGRLQVLVATTVIEVGVDVPHATLMVIEHAERFGLSQLHQLRGRVGRASLPSSCLLMSDSDGDTAQERIAAMVASNDGAELARVDARLRGHGDALGTAQHGGNPFAVFDLDAHSSWISAAQYAAVHLLKPGNERALDDLMAVHAPLDWREVDAARLGA